MAVKLADDPENFRAHLAIDRDDLDGCLEQHAELYYHVSAAYAEAVAQRDAMILDLEEAEAPVTEELRSKLARNKEHVTENRLKQILRMDPKFQQLQRRVLALRAKADAWSALKDSFQQRSFMLRELVQWTISHRHDLSLERGVVRDRSELVRQKISEEKKRRRSSA